MAGGLAICITSTGRKTFYIYRRVRGRPERLRLGSFPDLSVEQARGIARAIAGDLAKGDDPIAERRKARKTPTLKTVFDQWADIHARVHRRSFPEDERIFGKYMVEFHGVPLNRISTAKVAIWHGRLGKEHGPIMANRALNLLRTVFNYSPKLGYDGPNPAGKGVTRFTEMSRDRFLQKSEMQAFFTALGKAEQPWRDYIALLLFTGQRKSTVAAMRWENLDMEGNVWKIPKPKNNRLTTIPLTAPAIYILESRSLDREADCPWVFPSRNGGHLKDARKPWCKLLEDAGLKNLHLHDLRRSLGSWQATQGAGLAIIGASLGHADLKSTQIYSRVEQTAVRDSMSKAVDAMLEFGGVDGRLLLETDGKTIDVEPTAEGGNDG
jgi:integrase